MARTITVKASPKSIIYRGTQVYTRVEDFSRPGLYLNSYPGRGQSSIWDEIVAAPSCGHSRNLKVLPQRGIMWINPGSENSVEIEDVNAAARSLNLDVVADAEITIGADPEFELVVNGHVVRASEFRPRLRGLVGGADSSSIGVDGSGAQIEFRPSPGHTPEELISNFEQLLRRFATRAPASADLWWDGATYSLGGHIHIGGINPSSSLLRCLDDLFGTRLRKMNGPARKRSPYGRLGDYRSQPWGLEYRVPPAALFADREMLQLFLHCIATICKKAVKGFTYRKPWVREELMELLEINVTEYRRLWLLPRKYRKMAERPDQNRSMFVTWRVNRAVTRAASDVQVEYSTDLWNWNSTIRRNIKNVITQAVRSARVNMPVVVWFVGLHARRGDVNTIPLCGMNVIPLTSVLPHPEVEETEGRIIIRIGICRRLRELSEPDIVAGIAGAVSWLLANQNEE